MVFLGIVQRLIRKIAAGEIQLYYWKQQFNDVQILKYITEEIAEFSTLDIFKNRSLINQETFDCI